MKLVLILFASLIFCKSFCQEFELYDSTGTRKRIINGPAFSLLYASYGDYQWNPAWIARIDSAHEVSAGILLAENESRLNGIKIGYGITPRQRKLIHITYVYDLLLSSDKREFHYPATWGGSTGKPLPERSGITKTKELESYFGVRLKLGNRLFIAQKASTGFMIVNHSTHYTSGNMSDWKRTRLEFGVMAETTIGFVVPKLGNGLPRY